MGNYEDWNKQHFLGFSHQGLVENYQHPECVSLALQRVSPAWLKTKTISVQSKANLSTQKLSRTHTMLNSLN